MAINTALLIAAPMLQDYLVDKDGTPMSAGTITCYHDNSRTTLKNWYYQSGTPGNYTYIPLPNPLTLSAAGTICDINGVDTIPFFYPYDENNDTVRDPYYITIVNYFQTNQITRANFPFLGGSGVGPSVEVDDIENLIVNNGFWRNIAPNNLTNTPFVSYNLSAITSVVVAPSQHDGFVDPDIVFKKNNTSATDAVTFVPFPLTSSTPIPNFVSPEYYLNHNCSGAGSGETRKFYQLPIALHVNNLAAVPFTFSIQAQSGSSGSNVMSVYIFQDTGTGSASPAPTLIGDLTLNSTWSNYTITDIFAASTGLTLSNASDDAFYLQIWMPLNAICNINFTKPAIYLTSDIIPGNEFQTYDKVDSVISSPRTGDIRMSLNRFYPYGWVPMNDSTVGNVKSNATAYKQQDAWPLFNLLWGLFSNYDNGGINLLAQMYTSAGATTAYGGSALADWNANKAISLTKMMGRVILGTSTVLPGNYSTTFTSTANLITTANTMSFFNGMPVYFTGTSNLSTKLIYYVTNFNGNNQFNLSSTFANAMAGTIITFANDAGMVFSALQGSFEGEYSHTQLITEIAAHTHTFSTFSTIGTSPLPLQSNQTTGELKATTDSTGSNIGFNITQPGTFYNMFIKL